MPRCDHLVFRVANLDRTLAFYQQLLPAELLSRRQSQDFWRSEVAVVRPTGQEDFRIVFVLAHRVRWLLWLFHTLVPRQMRSQEHFGFACATLEELRERARLLEQLRVPTPNPLTQLDGDRGWLLEAVDPDGNAVEWTYGFTHR